MSAENTSTMFEDDHTPKGISEDAAKTLRRRAVAEVIARPAAAIKAMKAQERVAAAAAAASAEEKATVGLKYEENGGPLLEPLYEHTDLIDVQYLIALAEAGGIVPPWRDVPDCARINTTNLWRLRCWNEGYSLPVLVISHPRLDAHHPDRLGVTLRRILPVLIACWNKARRFGKHATVGVLFEFMSLPQGPDRTPAEQARFDAAQFSIHEWYAHPFAPVLLVSAPPPASPSSDANFGWFLRAAAAVDAGTGKADGVRCGWSFVERRVASLVKEDRVLWDLSGLDWFSEGAPISYAECCIALRAGPTARADASAQRECEPFMSPDVVERVLADGAASGALAFNTSADVDAAAAFYARGFVRAFEAFRQAGGSVIMHNGLGLGSEEAPVLAQALAYAHEHCKATDDPPALNLEENAFSNEDKKLLHAAVRDESRLWLLA